ncbi:hypothetical protein C8R45DRAFT_1124413 [Mycena sanguinolenta]|nr:hypothetical protein C8R45DRAFT_1124413 [Mycena sanguinolenta]
MEWRAILLSETSQCKESEVNALGLKRDGLPPASCLSFAVRRSNPHAVEASTDHSSLRLALDARRVEIGVDMVLDKSPSFHDYFVRRCYTPRPLDPSTLPGRLRVPALRCALSQASPTAAARPLDRAMRYLQTVTTLRSGSLPISSNWLLLRVGACLDTARTFIAAPLRTLLHTLRKPLRAPTPTRACIVIRILLLDWGRPSLHSSLHLRANVLQIAAAFGFASGRVSRINANAASSFHRALLCFVFGLPSLAPHRTFHFDYRHKQPRRGSPSSRQQTPAFVLPMGFPRAHEPGVCIAALRSMTTRLPGSISPVCADGRSTCGILVMARIGVPLQRRQSPRLPVPIFAFASTRTRGWTDEGELAAVRHLSAPSSCVDLGMTWMITMAMTMTRLTARRGVIPSPSSDSSSDIDNVGRWAGRGGHEEDGRRTEWGRTTICVIYIREYFLFSLCCRRCLYTHPHPRLVLLPPPCPILVYSIYVHLPTSFARCVPRPYTDYLVLLLRLYVVRGDDFAVHRRKSHTTSSWSLCVVASGKGSPASPFVTGTRMSSVFVSAVFAFAGTRYPLALGARVGAGTVVRAGRDHGTY